ncbi:hypothetical protein Tco_0920323 [Tanacetum coccineum]
MEWACSPLLRLLVFERTGSLRSGSSFSHRNGVFVYVVLLWPCSILSYLSDLVRWDDVLLLDKLLWIFPEEWALSLVRDVPEDSLNSHSNKSFVPELSEFSSSDSS